MTPPPPAVFVALGTNLGDRERNLARGVAGLAQRSLRTHERLFVLAPLAEIAPGARHPVLGLTAAEMAAGCLDPSAVAIYGPPELVG